ncbi:MAG: hypothetical protein ACK4SO_02590, partial [Candidatus Kapaibacteriota bacterium]
ILGTKTSIGFMIKVLEHPEWISGNTYTNFIEKHFGDGYSASDELLKYALAAASIAFGKVKKPTTFIKVKNEIPSPWLTLGNWEIALGKH